MVIKRVNMRQYFDLPHPQLRSYLARQVIGSPSVYTTPLFGDETRFQEVVDEWMAILERECAHLSHLMEFENDLRGKVGPLSVQKPLDARMADVEAYYTSILRESSPMPSEVIELTWRKRWRAIRNIRMYSQDQVLDQMKLSTNSGTPYFTQRRIVLDRGLLGTAEYDNNEGWKLVTPTGEYSPASVLGWRGQEKGPLPTDTAQRVLWMFSMMMNCMEAEVYAPALRHFQQRGLMPTWLGQEAVDATMTALFQSKPEHDYLIGTDFTKFDQHFGPHMQDVALQCARLIMEPGDRLDSWCAQVFPFKYYTPLVLKWATISEGKHGMASGSNGTNWDETMAHSCLQTYAAVRAGANLNLHSMCLGDDGVVTYPGAEVDRVIEAYTSLGLEMNPSKQSVFNDRVVFLRRLYSTQLSGKTGVLRGVYSTARALGKLKYLERYVDPDVYGPEYLIVRSMSIIENCSTHPAREAFADFCILGDKYGLGTKIPGFFNRDHFAKVVKEVQAAGGLGYQYTDSLNPRPATSWWIYQYLRSKV